MRKPWKARWGEASGKGHYTSVMPFLYGARYVVCKEPGCGHVIRNTLVWPPMEPLIHKGGKPWRRGRR
jgi:hypothetical protein